MRLLYSSSFASHRSRRKRSAGTPEESTHSDHDHDADADETTQAPPPSSAPHRATSTSKGGSGSGSGTKDSPAMTPGEIDTPVGDGPGTASTGGGGGTFGRGKRGKKDKDDGAEGTFVLSFMLLLWLYQKMCLVRRASSWVSIQLFRVECTDTDSSSVSPHRASTAETAEPVHLPRKQQQQQPSVGFQTQCFEHQCCTSSLQTFPSQTKERSSRPQRSLAPRQGNQDRWRLLVQERP